MKLKDAKTLIIQMVKHKVKAPLVLRGGAGIGKTQTVIDIGNELNIPVVILRLGSLSDSGDLLGLPIIIEEEGQKITKFSDPWWFKIFTEKNTGILFLDELNRCKQQMLDSIMQLLDQRRLNEYVLPDGVIIVGAINPDSDEYYVSEFEKAMRDRLVIIDVTNEFEDVYNYFLNMNAPAEILELLMAGKDELIVDDRSKGTEKNFTPRGIRQLIQFFEVAKNVGCLNEIVLACIGPVGLQIWRNLKIYKDVPDAEEYLKNSSRYDVENYDIIKQRILLGRLAVAASKILKNENYIKSFAEFLKKLKNPVFALFYRLACENPQLSKLLSHPIIYSNQELETKARQIEEIRNRK